MKNSAYSKLTVIVLIIEVVMALSLLFSACGSGNVLESTTTLTKTIILTLTPTPTSTLTPTKTLTPTPTLTITPTPTAYGGYRPGQLVAYVTGEDVTVSEIDNSNPIKVSDNLFKEIYPTLLGWSPDGRWVFFTEAMYCSGNCGEFTHLWAVHPDGSGLIEVYSNPTDSHHIAWKPDGTLFIFGCNAADASYSSNKKFCLGNVEDFTITPTNFAGQHPKYSPDGTRLAWAEESSERANISTLSVLEDIQSEPIPVVTAKIWGGEFTWLSDSETLVYVERKNRSTCDFYKVDYRNPIPIQLISLEQCYDYFRSIVGEPSPDGNYLVYYYQKRAYILNLKVTGKTIYASGLRDARLYWSPDGKLFGLVPGYDAVMIDPETGTVSTPNPAAPWLSISKWAPNNWYFYYETVLQP